jgi:hypothetical protein
MSSPFFQVLGYMVKFFAKMNDIGDASRGSLSSYAYILMAIFYLQQCNPPVLPVLQVRIGVARSFLAQYTKREKCPQFIYQMGIKYTYPTSPRLLLIIPNFIVLGLPDYTKNWCMYPPINHFCHICLLHQAFMEWLNLEGIGDKRPKYHLLLTCQKCFWFKCYLFLHKLNHNIVIKEKTTIFLPKMPS